MTAGFKVRNVSDYLPFPGLSDLTSLFSISSSRFTTVLMLLVNVMYLNVI